MAEIESNRKSIAIPLPNLPLSWAAMYVTFAVGS
jgi:hypothetical protein